MNRHPAAAGTAARLARLAWLSVAAALTTIGLKTAAWALTGSIGFLSDAAESVVNLVTALMAVAVLRWVALPPDEEHQYGHGKAEYFAAGVEGALILLAALGVALVSINRLLSPRALTDVGLGVAISGVAAAVNLAVAVLLIRSGREHRSIALEADGRHLMADVWTSVGVIVGVTLAAVTGWRPLDPVVALGAAVNILVSGVVLVRRSSGGLMDRALPPVEVAAVRRVLDGLTERGVRHHALRTRQAGRRAFVSMHILVPGDWTVRRGHLLVEEIEQGIREALPHATVFTHIEPIEDPASYEDTGLDRAGGA